MTRVRTAFSWLLIVGGLAGGLAGAWIEIAGFADSGTAALVALPGLIGLALAAILVLRVPDNRLSLVVSLIMFTSINLDLLTPAVEWLLDTDRLTLAIVLTHVSNLLFVTFLLSLVVLIPIWFPTGRAIGMRWEWIWRIAVLGAGLAGVGSAFAEQTCVSSPDNYNCERWAAAPWGMAGWTEDTFTPFIIVAFAMGIPALISLVLRFRRSETVERQQIRWLMFSVTPLLPLFFAQLIGKGLLGWEMEWVPLAFNVLFTSMLVSIGLAVLKYRLYELDKIISRTLAYAVVVGFLGFMFAAGVVWLPSALNLDDSLAVAVTTLAVAGLFNPLRKQVQLRVDRRFNRSRYDAERVVEVFVSSLRDRVDSDAVVYGWIGVVSETMQPSGVGVWVRR